MDKDKDSTVGRREIISLCDQLNNTGCLTSERNAVNSLKDKLTAHCCQASNDMENDNGPSLYSMEIQDVNKSTVDDLKRENDRLAAELHLLKNELAYLKMERYEPETTMNVCSFRSSVVGEEDDENNDLPCSSTNSAASNEHHYYNLPLRNGLTTSSNGDYKICMTDYNLRRIEGHEKVTQRDITVSPRTKKDYEAKYHQMKATIIAVQYELNQAKDALFALKNDKKKLKAEKFELLDQMKEVYNTLESKEIELREFIRQFEQKMLETDDGIKQLLSAKANAELDREGFAEASRRNEELLILTKANLELEQSETTKLRFQLKELQGRFALLTNHTVTIDDFENLEIRPTAKCIANGFGDARGNNSYPLLSNHADFCSPGNSNNSRHRSFDTNSNLNGYQNTITTNHCAIDKDNENSFLRCRRQSTPKNRSCSKIADVVRSPAKSENRLSKLFHLKRTKSKEIASENIMACELNNNDPIASDLCLAEKAEKLIEARQIPVVRWRQAHVLAWLELELGMGQYSKIFAENIKSGRVLINLSNNEFERSLKLTNPMHKKKLRLAIEEYRAPTLWKFPLIKEINTHFVCSNFLPSIGLNMYIEIFRSNLVDGRIMNYLNKDQMSKYLNISKRFHQTSILKAIELLRLFNYDMKVLNKRRLDCEKDNADLLVWTNARMAKWLRQIDLEEYAGHIDNSGLHGAVSVLDAAFTADTLANVIKIPTSKKMIRKHLADEFDNLQQQSRSRILADQCFNTKDYTVNRPVPKSIALARGFVRSNTADGSGRDGFEALANLKKRNGIRGSIVRAFGTKAKNDYEKVDSEFLFKFGNDLSKEKILQPHVEFTDVEARRRMSGSMGAGLDRSSATLSSTTSDLGSSIERSQHLKTILAPASQVLTQKPMTSNESTPKKSSSAKLAAAVFGPTSPLRRTGSSAAVKTITSEDSSFSALLRTSLFRQNDQSPSSSFNTNLVKMRRKKCNPNDKERLTPKRPHSMGDFTKPASPSYTKLDATKIDGGRSLVSYLITKQLSNNGLFKNWMSVENLLSGRNHFNASPIVQTNTSNDCDSAVILKTSDANDRRKIDTIAECRELETSAESNQQNVMVVNSFPEFPLDKHDTSHGNNKKYEYNENLLSRGGWRKRRTKSVYSLCNGQQNLAFFQEDMLSPKKVTAKSGHQEDSGRDCELENNERPQSLAFQCTAGLLDPALTQSPRQIIQNQKELLSSENIGNRNLRRSSSLNTAHETEL